MNLWLSHILSNLELVDKKLKASERNITKSHDKCEEKIGKGVIVLLLADIF